MEIMQFCTKPSTCITTTKQSSTNTFSYFMGYTISRIILWMCPANERWCYIVTLPLIGLTHLYTKWSLQYHQNKPSLTHASLPQVGGCPSCSRGRPAVVYPGKDWSHTNLKWNKNMMAECQSAVTPEHYLNQCWPRSILAYVNHMPQWIKEYKISKYHNICYL